jgi:transcriptional regulator with XRE-family HTH domain
MKDRLLEFLKAENKTSAQFAEEIGVQASGISHILSGRNNPSLDFVLKMLEKYRYISTDWLLFGKGSMYKDVKMQTLFEDDQIFNKIDDSKHIKDEIHNSDFEFKNVRKEETKSESVAQSENRSVSIMKIVWFYSNYTFEEFFPR